MPNVDSVVLFSASQRANGGRKRWKHTGQTASIYLSNKLGGKQVGTLVHTLAIRKGPIIYDSISNNKGETIRPLLDKYIPKDVPVFSDSGYRFYFRINKNHRMVNHDRRSADPRYKFARNRWCLNGVHNQVAEGNHRILKWNFTAGYGYIRPEYSQLYLNEYAFWKNVKYFGWDKLILSEEENRKVAAERKKIGYETNEQKSKESLQQKVANNNNGLIEKKGEDGSNQRGRVKGQTGKETRFVGQNNGVIEGKNQGFEQAGTSGKGLGEKEGFRRFCDEAASTKRAGASARLGLVRNKICET